MAMLRACCIAASAVLTVIPSLAFAQGPEAAPPPMARPPEPEEARPAPNSVFAEGLGAGIAYSINYERRVIDDLGVRVGFSYISVASSVSSDRESTESSGSFVTFPVTVSYLGVRGGKHALEVGGGGTLAYASTRGSAFASSSSEGVGGFGTLFLGYRLHPVGRAGFQFRIGAMALIGPGLNVFGDDPYDVGVLPWGYISFGAGF